MLKRIVAGVAVLLVVSSITLTVVPGVRAQVMPGARARVPLELQAASLGYQVIKFGPVSFGPGNGLGQAAWCPQGKRAVSGGVYTTAPNGEYKTRVYSSYPAPNPASANTEGWTTAVFNDHTWPVSATFYAICIIAP